MAEAFHATNKCRVPNPLAAGEGIYALLTLINDYTFNHLRQLT